MQIKQREEPYGHLLNWATTYVECENGEETALTAGINFPGMIQEHQPVMIRRNDYDSDYCEETDHFNEMENLLEFNQGLCATAATTSIEPEETTGERAINLRGLNQEQPVMTQRTQASDPIYGMQSMLQYDEKENSNKIRQGALHTRFGNEIYTSTVIEEFQAEKMAVEAGIEVQETIAEEHDYQQHIMIQNTSDYASEDKYSTEEREVCRSMARNHLRWSRFHLN